MFWLNVQIPCVFPDRDGFGLFSQFSLCSGDPDIDNEVLYVGMGLIAIETPGM